MGFSLTELMIAVAIFSVISGAAIGVYVMSQNMWHATSINMAASRAATTALSRMVYGVATNSGLTNSGLRSASSVIYISSNSAWTGGTNYPPKPGASTHSLTNGTNGTSDGSWRLICVNPVAGTHWIDYNKKASNIVYWMDTSNPSSRQLIGNYIYTSSVSTNASSVSVQLIVSRREGRFASTISTISSNRVGTNTTVTTNWNWVGTTVFMRNSAL